MNYRIIPVYKEGFIVRKNYNPCLIGGFNKDSYNYFQEKLSLSITHSSGLDKILLMPNKDGRGPKGDGKRDGSGGGRGGNQGGRRGGNKGRSGDGKKPSGGKKQGGGKGNC